MKVLARSLDGRYLVGDDLRPLSLARIVEPLDGRVSDEIRVGSIMAQSDPREWVKDDGSSPEARRSLELASR